MKTKARGFLSAALALVMVLALMVPAVSALDISVGNEFGGGKVTAFEVTCPLSSRHFLWTPVMQHKHNGLPSGFVLS